MQLSHYPIIQELSDNESVEEVAGEAIKDEIRVNTFGYSVDASLCLELWPSNDLPDLMSDHLQKADTKGSVLTVLKKYGKLKLWRDIRFSPTIKCTADGN